MTWIQTAYGKIEEKYASRVVDDNDSSPRAETVWRVWEVADESEAYLSLVDIPQTFTFTASSQTGVLTNLTAREVGEHSASDFEYEATAVYTVRPQLDDVEYSFTAGSQSVTLTHSLGTVAATGGGRTAPDFKGGINVSPDGKIQGLSIERPQFTFTVTKQWPRELITTSYQLLVASMVGTVNSAEYYGLAKGCVKLNGAQGGPKGKRWPISYEFEYSPPESGVVVGDISGISREGWQYLDIYRRTIDSSATKTLDVPHTVYVHQVYPYTNFALLGL